MEPYWGRYWGLPHEIIIKLAVRKFLIDESEYIL